MVDQRQRLDFHTRSEIQHSIERMDELTSCGIFQPENSKHILFQSAFIEMLIVLRDLMYKSNKYAQRISFTDDVCISKKIKDVSDLIKYVRDAMCHPDSDNHYIEVGNIKSTFNVVFGQGTILKINDYEQTSLYKDDICFFFGSKGIYYKRHILRAYHEAKANLEPYI